VKATALPAKKHKEKEWLLPQPSSGVPPFAYLMFVLNKKAVYLLSIGKLFSPNPVLL
jgi:hypothetical protein